MAIYSLAQLMTATSTGVASWEIRAASTDRPRIMEIGIFLNAATASAFGLGRPAAIGVTPTSPVTVLAEDPGDPAGTVQCALAWATGPTIPTQFFRRINLPATIGAGVIWTFPRGLVIAQSGISSIILWNLSAVAAANVYVVVDE